MSKSICNLPLIPLHICNDYTKYPEYENTLFEIFDRIYNQEHIFYHGIRVLMKRYPPDYNIRTGFYHIICENYDHTGNESDRNPNFRRCERIEWPKEFIEFCSNNCDNVMVWNNSRHGKINTLIYCPDYDYLVVLSQRNNYYLLTTAYPIEHDHTRDKLFKEYDAFINKQRTSD